jgi:hypothetical protein
MMCDSQKTIQPRTAHVQGTRLKTSDMIFMAQESEGLLLERFSAILPM